MQFATGWFIPPSKGRSEQFHLLRMSRSTGSSRHEAVPSSGSRLFLYTPMLSLNTGLRTTPSPDLTEVSLKHRLNKAALQDPSHIGGHLFASRSKTQEHLSTYLIRLSINQ